MPISVTCWQCGKIGSAPDKAVGRTATCKKCGTRLVVPPLTIIPAPVPEASAPTALPRPLDPAAPPVPKASADAKLPDWLANPTLHARSVPKKPATTSKPAERKSPPPLARDRKRDDASDSEIEPYVLEVIPPPTKRPKRRALWLVLVLVAVPSFGLALLGVLMDPKAGLHGDFEITNGKDALSKAQVKENFKALARAQGYVWNGVDRRLPGIYLNDDVMKAMGRTPPAAEWVSELGIDINAPIRSTHKAECTDGAILLLLTEAKLNTDFSFVEIVDETNERLKPGMGWDDKRRSLLSRDQEK
jgi:hypothetical protein